MIALLVASALLAQERRQRLLGDAVLAEEIAGLSRMEPVPEVALARLEPHVLRERGRGECNFSFLLTAMVASGAILRLTSEKGNCHRPCSPPAGG